MKQKFILFSPWLLKSPVKRGAFLEGGVELPPKSAGPQITGRFEEERPRPEAKTVTQERALLSFDLFFRVKSL